MRSFQNVIHNCLAGTIISWSENAAVQRVDSATKLRFIILYGNYISTELLLLDEVFFHFFEGEIPDEKIEKIEKNLRKKSEKYNVSYESLIDKYFEYRNTKSAENAFDKLNNYLVSEDDKPNKRGDDAKGHKRPTEDGAGLTRAGAKAAGVKTAVTTPPSKLDPDGKAAKRRKSFCARMGGMKGPMKDEKGRPTRKAMSLKRWNC